MVHSDNMSERAKMSLFPGFSVYLRVSRPFLCTRWRYGRHAQGNTPDVEPRHMRAPRVSIQLSEADRELIEQEAEVQGVSMSQFMREASVARAAFLMGQRSDDPGRTIETIARRLSS